MPNIVLNKRTLDLVDYLKMQPIEFRIAGEPIEKENGIMFIKDESESDDTWLYVIIPMKYGMSQTLELEFGDTKSAELIYISNHYCANNKILGMFYPTEDDPAFTDHSSDTPKTVFSTDNMKPISDSCFTETIINALERVIYDKFDSNFCEITPPTMESLILTCVHGIAHAENPPIQNPLMQYKEWMKENNNAEQALLYKFEYKAIKEISKLFFEDKDALSPFELMTNICKHSKIYSSYEPEKSVAGFLTTIAQNLYQTRIFPKPNLATKILDAHFSNDKAIMNDFVENKLKLYEDKKEKEKMQSADDKSACKDDNVFNHISVEPPCKKANISVCKPMENNSEEIEEIEEIKDIDVVEKQDTEKFVPIHETTGLYLDYTPQMIYDLISENVIGQDAAKQSAAMLVWNHIHGRGRNIVMAGPTGCGKTEIWKTLSQTFNFIKIINGPNLTPEGAKGEYKLGNIFAEEFDTNTVKALVEKYADGSTISEKDEKEIDAILSKPSKIIMVIDEADKLFEPIITANSGDWSKLVQNELLKIMDHEPNNIVKYVVKHLERTVDVEVNCETLSIVLCGSFEKMLENKNIIDSSMGFTSKIDPDKHRVEASDCNELDLVKYANIRVEIAGRINDIATLDPMSESKFFELLKHPVASPIHKLEKELDIKIRVNKKARELLAKKAIDTQLGCRIIKSKILNVVDKMLFANPDMKTLDVSNNIIKSITNDN